MLDTLDRLMTDAARSGNETRKRKQGEIGVFVKRVGGIAKNW